MNNPISLKHLGKMHLFVTFITCIFVRFLENEDEIARLRKCFAGLWSLDSPEGVNGAMERPELYVLKPQREGGGLIFAQLR